MFRVVRSGFLPGAGWCIGSWWSPTCFRENLDVSVPLSRVERRQFLFAFVLVFVKVVWFVWSESKVLSVRVRSRLHDDTSHISLCARVQMCGSVGVRRAAEEAAYVLGG